MDHMKNRTRNLSCKKALAVYRTKFLCIRTILRRNQNRMNALAEFAYGVHLCGAFALEGVQFCPVFFFKLYIFVVRYF